MSETPEISGYTPAEWCKNEALILVIDDIDDNGDVAQSVRVRDHYVRGSPAWPPLEPNGDEWYIEQVD